MAEDVKRSYFEIIEELFFGPSAALEKYAKVRFTQYEMNLWRRYHLPLKDVDSKAKRYFGVRFLGEGKRIDKASETDLNKAFESLKFAVGKDVNEPTLNSGCHMRCLRIVNELNEALAAAGLTTIEDPEKFLDFLTFDYEVRTDGNGVAIEEKPYGFLIRTFHDEENRRQFRVILKWLREEKRMMSMQDIYKIASFAKNHSKKGA